MTSIIIYFIINIAILLILSFLRKSWTDWIETALIVLFGIVIIVFMLITITALYLIERDEEYWSE